MSRYGGYEDLPELPELYDSVPLYASRRDVGFYVDLCRGASGEVLELGCGTGRVLIPAAESGCVITGLDQSALMLERCRAKLQMLPREVHKRVTLVQSDMTNFQLRRTFTLVIVPFRPLQHLVTVDEQISFLRCVSEHLKPEGQLVFDVFHADPQKVAGPVSPEEIEDTPELRLADGRFLRRTFRLLAKRRSEQCNDVELVYYVRHPNGETRRSVQTFPMRYFFRYEIEHLLARTGFQVTALYGDFDRSAFTDGSPEMIVTAKKVTR
jgi:SAM-dependent methyltransferase